MGSGQDTTKEDEGVRWWLEEMGITVASPRHGEEGCALLVFMLCEFTHVLGKTRDIPAQLSCKVVRLREREEEERASQ